MTPKQVPSFFESIRITERSIPLLSLHYERIRQSISHFDLHDLFLSMDELKNLILEKSLSIDSREVKARLTLKIENNILRLDEIECTPIEPTQVTSDRPIKLTLYEEGFKDSQSPFSNYKTESKLLYQDSINYAHALGCDQSIILNERNEVVETSICNIFFQKGEQIYTPPLSSGCINGIMRRLIILERGVHEKTISLESLGDFDSIFLTNAVRGQLKAIYIAV